MGRLKVTQTGSPIGGKANQRFQVLVKQLKTQINYKNRNAKPTKVFLQTLANATQDFSVR